MNERKWIAQCYVRFEGGDWLGDLLKADSYEELIPKLRASWHYRDGAIIAYIENNEIHIHERIKFATTDDLR